MLATSAIYALALMVQTALCGITVVTLRDCLSALLYDPAKCRWKQGRDILWTMVAATIVVSSLAMVETALFGRAELIEISGMQAALDDSCFDPQVNTCRSPLYGKGSDGLLSPYPLTPLLIVQIAIGDAILIYRCWVVYNKRWLVIIPSLLLYLVTVAGGILAIFIPFDVIQGALVMTMALNILTTTLTVRKLVLVERSLKAVDKNSSAKRAQSSPSLLRLRKIARVTIDSAALYTICIILAVVTFFSASFVVSSIFDGILTQLVPINFNLIIIRIDRARQAERLRESHEPILSTLRAAPVRLVRRPTSSYRSSVIRAPICETPQYQLTEADTLPEEDALDMRPIQDVEDAAGFTTAQVEPEPCCRHRCRKHQPADDGMGVLRYVQFVPIT